MKIVKRLIIFSIFVIVVIVVGEFIASNKEEVNIKLFSQEAISIPTYLLTFVSFGLGFLVITIICLIELVRLQLTVIELRKKVSKYEKK